MIALSSSRVFRGSLPENSSGLPSTWHVEAAERTDANRPRRILRRVMGWLQAEHS
jgi:hypothetical protein